MSRKSWFWIICIWALFVGMAYVWYVGPSKVIAVFSRTEPAIKISKLHYYPESRLMFFDVDGKSVGVAANGITVEVNPERSDVIFVRWGGDKLFDGLAYEKATVLVRSFEA